MHARYDHKEIEQKWQEYWDEHKVYVAPDTDASKENQYVLFEFPYPSGNLHIGHWYAFSVPDIYVRARRMQGYNVLFPVGFDSFGLPAENAAIKHGKNPREWTEGNIEFMSKQLKTMGALFDWSREVRTSSPDYYKWTQWLFLQFFNNKLAYQDETAVNWCPSCNTVLANEQVVSGKCERCDHEVEQKQMRQWLFGITQYADQLVDSLDSLDWPDEIKEAQRNWIGRSEGATIKFQIANFKSQIEVFTTRPDTIFGATYMVLAPEHSLIADLKSQISNWEEVEKYIENSRKKTELERTDLAKEKTGVPLKGISAINPANGEEVPVWIADYVLAGYGTGAIMAVPAHDDRDYEFATQYNLPIQQVVAPMFAAKEDAEDALRPGKETIDRDIVYVIAKHWDKDAYLCLDWTYAEHWRSFVIGGIDKGEDVLEAAKRELAEETGYTSVKSAEEIPHSEIHTTYFAGHKDVNRYGRCRVVYVELADDTREEISEEEQAKHELVWVDKENVHEFQAFNNLKHAWSVLQGDITSYAGDGIVVNSDFLNDLTTEEAKKKITSWLEEEGCGRASTTYRLRDWLVSRQRYWGCPIPIIHCDTCGAVPVPEKELPVVLPEDVDFKPTGESPLAQSKSFHEVVCPSCGASGDGVRRESDTMDTFVDSSWYFLRYTDPRNEDEFASREKMEHWMPVDVYSGGAEHTTMHLLYSRFFIKALKDLDLIPWDEPYARRHNRGLIMGPDGQKMSKSKGNVIDPDENVKTFGADSVRMYLAFIGPYNQVGSYPWDMNGIVGIKKFLEKVWKRVVVPTEGESAVSQEVKEKLLHQTIKKVTQDIGRFKFNTAISHLMVFVNKTQLAYGNVDERKDALETFLKLLHPFAPHITEELWHQLGNANSIVLESWPSFDEELAKDDEIELVFQVNGKVRDKMMVSAGITKEDAKQHALASEKVQSFLDGKEPKKIIFVQGKLVNIVV